jgi:hypothetical protein
VAPANYPGLRYVRHAQDGFSPGTTREELAQALRDAQQLVDELKKVGLAV